MTEITKSCKLTNVAKLPEYLMVCVPCRVITRAFGILNLKAQVFPSQRRRVHFPSLDYSRARTSVLWLPNTECTISPDRTARMESSVSLSFEVVSINCDPMDAL